MLKQEDNNSKSYSRDVWTSEKYARLSRTFRLFRHLCCTIYSIATVSMLRKATPDAEILEVGSTKYVFIYSQFEETWSM